MKKFKLALVTVLAFLMGLVCFAACGKTSYAGTYKFESMVMTMTGMETKLKVGEEFMAGMTLTEDFTVIELKEDGTVTMTMAGESAETGTWKEAEGKNKITITIEDEPQTVSCDGKTLTMTTEDEEELGGMKMTLTLKKK